MQSLFALQQCKDANYELCIDQIGDAFMVDLNSMEVQDKTLLATQKKTAIKAFQKAFQLGDTSIEHDDVKIKKSVNSAFQFYVTQSKKDTEFFLKNLIGDIERIYDHYIAALTLAGAFAELAESDKKGSHKNFINNSWIKAIRESEQLQKFAVTTGKHWNDKQDRVRSWFRDVVRHDNEYASFIDKKEPTVEDQKKFINHLFRKIILGKTVINEYFEEEVLRWAEDRDIVKGLLEKTIKAFSGETNEVLTLHTLSVNWEEDKNFIEKLYRGGSQLDDYYKEIIASNTRNWEVDRLALTDRIILEMSIAEMLEFPNIPVKVTMNEYIELAKNYSTPKSRQFVNGILDVIAKELKNTGNIRKSGRGLMDNK
jgi:N utilization substance protein B